MIIKKMNQTSGVQAAERIKRFGLECTGPGSSKEIIYQPGWIPGGEYIQKLTIRNVSGSIKKFKYKLPSSRFFSMSFPELITLSPGCFVCFDIIFRPVKLSLYDDSIFITVQDAPEKGLNIPVRALLSSIIVTVPNGLDFGYCPTNQLTDMFFTLDNVGEIDAPFQWEVPSPFIMEPSRGMISIGEKKTIKVSICPSDASVFVAQAVCKIGDGTEGAIIPTPELVTKFSAIGKYAYIILSESSLDFGEVTCGDQITREIVLQNKSVVPTDFTLIRFDKDCDESFSIEPSTGVIPGQSEIFVTVKYKALAAGSYIEDKYAFRTPGNCDAPLLCRATAISPLIVLTRNDRNSIDNLEHLESGNRVNAFNFGDSELGHTESRIFSLVNKSHRNVSFSFATERESVFRITPVSGVCKPLNEVTIKVVFSPSVPINFYRRVFYLVEDSLPQFIDLMGSGYIRAKGEAKEVRPHPLRFAHVQAMRNRSVAGLGYLAPDELDTMSEMRMENGLDENLFAKTGKAGTVALSTSLVRSPITRSGEATRTDVAVAHEFFIEDSDASAHEVFLNKTRIDFGFTPYMTTSDRQTVSVTNNADGKVTVLWFVPVVPDTDAKPAQGTTTTSVPVFAISPSTIDIEPRKSQLFSVTFSSKQSNRNFMSSAEVVIYFKNQRTFRLVNDATMTPPWHLQLHLRGHTFASGQLLASVKITGSGVRHGKLVFPCAYVGECIFETVLLQNSSNLPAMFHAGVAGVSGESNSEGFEEDAFSVKPEAGQIAANGFVHLCVRFNPHAVRTCLQRLCLIVNGAEGSELLLEGSGAVPFVVLPDIATSGLSTSVPEGLQGSFYLQPTSMGLSTSRVLRIQNGSRLPLRFDIRLPENIADKNILSVMPARGVIKGNQCITVSVEFRPKKPIRMIYKLEVLVYPIGGLSGRVIDARQPGRAARPECIQSLAVNVVTAGDVSALAFSPYTTITPVQLIHTSENSLITLENISDSELFYELYCEVQFIADTTGHEVSTISQATYKLEKNVGKYESKICSLYCSAPSGSLPARSTNKVRFTVQPEYSGAFTFKVFARLQSAASDGSSVMLDNTAMATRRLQLLNQLEDMEDLALVAVIESRSSFPKLVFEDIRTEDSIISDLDQLWRQFSLSSLNYDLARPLTDGDLPVSAMTSKWEELKKYSFNFTPKPHYSPPEIVRVQIRNHGSLPASFHLHYPNEQELELEPWVDEEELTEERLMQTNIIEKLKCFNVEPMRGTLQPNETCVLTFKYCYESIKYAGIHRLNLCMIVDRGKTFVIELIGKTIPVEKGYNPRKMHASKSITLDHIQLVPFADLDNNAYLKPVPIGLTALLAPEQRLEIVNVSEVEVSYEVDTAALDLHTANFSHGLNLFKLENPKGVIPGLSSVYLKWKFFPLEATLYEFPLIIRYLPSVNIKIQEKIHEVNNPITAHAPLLRRRSSFGLGAPLAAQVVTQSFSALECATLNLNMKCLGYDPRESIRPKYSPIGEEFTGANPPISQLIRLPETDQPVVLSVDFIDFGVVPAESSTAALLIIRNKLTSAIKFAIEPPTDKNVFNMLRLSQLEGTIGPLSSLLINIRLVTEGCAAKIFQERLRIVVREVFSDDVTPSITSLFSKTTDKGAGGKTNYNQKRDSVAVKSTAARRIQVSETSVPGGRTASLPTPHAVEVEAFRSLNMNSDIMSLANSSVSSAPSDYRSNTAGSKNTISAGSKLSASLTSTAKVHAPPSRSSAGTPSRGGLKRAGTSEFGPPSYFYLRIQGEVHAWDTLANMLFKAGQQDTISHYLITPKRVDMSKKSTTGTSVTDILPPVSDKVIADRIKQARKETEVRVMAECVLQDLFRTLLNPWDIGPAIIEATTAVSGGLSIDGSLNKPLIGNPVYGLYFDDCNILDLEKRFLLEIRHSLAIASPPPPVASNYLAYVEKHSIPNYWIADENRLFADRKCHLIDRDNFYVALGRIGFTSEDDVYKAIDKWIKLRADASSDVHVYQLVRDIPTEHKRTFAKLVNTAYCRRKRREKEARRSPSYSTELGEGSISSSADESSNKPDPSLTPSSRQLSADVHIQSSFRADLAKMDTSNIQEKNIEKESRLAFVNRVGFIDIMADILHNTVFDLMDEAVHGEFSIDGGPVRTHTGDGRTGEFDLDYKDSPF